MESPYASPKAQLDNRQAAGPQGAVRERDYFLAWILSVVAGALAGFVVGAAAGGVIGGVGHAMGYSLAALTNVIRIVGITGGILMSYLSFRLVVAKIIVRRAAGSEA